MNVLQIDPAAKQPPTRDLPSSKAVPQELPAAKQSNQHPLNQNGNTNASLFFVGTATTILYDQVKIGIVPTDMKIENGRASDS